MKISAVIAPKKLNFKPQNTSVLLSFLPIALGLVAGSVIYVLCEEYLTGKLWDYFISFATEFSQKNGPEIFSGLIVSNLPYIILMFLFGTCAVGAPIVPMLSFIKSAGLSLTATYIYATYALEGIEYCLLVFFPGKVLLLFAMLLLTQSSFTTSREVNKAIKGIAETQVRLVTYILRSALICAVFILSSLVDFLMIISFSSLFSFS